MTLDEKLAHLRCARSNIERYRRLLKTQLTDYERDYIRKCLAEEQTKIRKMLETEFPITIGTDRRAFIPAMHPSA